MKNASAQSTQSLKDEIESLLRQLAVEMTDDRQRGLNVLTTAEQLSLFAKLSHAFPFNATTYLVTAIAGSQFVSDDRFEPIGPDNGRSQ